MRALILVLILALTPLVVAGQLASLTDAAKRAETERKAANPPSFTQRDLIDIEWMITRVGFEAYASARTDVAGVRRRNKDLNQKLFDASRGVAALTDMAPVFGAEPAIAQVLGRYGLNSREYLRREYAVVNAMAWAQRKPPDSLKSRPIRMQNIDFVKANDRFMRETAARYQRAESTPPWFEPARFVEKP